MQRPGGTICGVALALKMGFPITPGGWRQVHAVNEYHRFRVRDGGKTWLSWTLISST